MLAFPQFCYYVLSHAEWVVLYPGKDQVTGCGSIERAFGSGGSPLRGWSQIVLAELDEGFLDAPGGGGSDALVDGEGLPQAGGAFAGRLEGAEAYRGFMGPFVQIVTAAKMIAAFGDDETALVMYDTQTAPVNSAPGAEYVTVKDGKITYSRFVFDRAPFDAARNTAS